VTGYNKQKEMAKIFTEVDEGEDQKSIMSSIDVQEYWENIKRTVKEDNRIFDGINDGDEGEDQKGDFTYNVMHMLGNERNTVHDDFQVHHQDEDLVINNPKNETERMLQNKRSELNKVRSDYHELKRHYLHEKNLRIKSDDKIVRLKRQHENEKKTLAVKIKSEIEDYFEKKIMNVGLLYEEEIVFLFSNNK
jgi:hypothetical protein